MDDFGRAPFIKLAVLVDRGGRELPIQPDYVGLNFEKAPSGHKVFVRLMESDGAEEISTKPRS